MRDRLGCRYRGTSGPAGLVVLLAVTGLVAIGPGAWGQTTLRLTDAGWSEAWAPRAGTAEAMLQEARRAILRDEPKEAESLARQWLEDHARHPLEPAARLVLADALVGQRSYFKALFEYEFLIRAFPGSAEFFTALEREYEIARLFVNGMNRKLLGMRIVPAEGEGEELLIRIQERAPGSELAERAMILLADYYFGTGEMDLATETYDVFLINYPRSERREWAMLRLIQAHLATFKGPEFNATGLLDASEVLRQYRREFPASARSMGIDGYVARIEESLARKDMFVADWHRRRGQGVSAAYLYRRLIQDYPTTEAAFSAVEKLREMGALATHQATSPTRNTADEGESPAVLPDPLGRSDTGPVPQDTGEPATQARES